MKKNTQQSTLSSLVLYQTSKGEIEFRGDFKNETIWATQAQIAEVFGVERSVITKHLKNIYQENELDQKATCAKIAQVQIEGNRTITRSIEHYNLDLIISVGYRVNSKNATQFRVWATKTLREYITKGYVINKKHVRRNYQQFLKTIQTIQDLLPEHNNLDTKVILDLVREFSATWTSLDSYDKESLQKIGANKKSVAVSADELLDSIKTLRSDLIDRGEATDIFASERSHGSVAGIIGNIMQSIGGVPVYPTVEEKSAHLLYFMVKNHPFVDGNKRCGAWAFIWFLRKARVRGYRNINPAALTALTLLIAESKSAKMDQMIALVMNVLAF